MILNDADADRRFLRDCRAGNTYALDRWLAESYWTTVASQIKDILVTAQRGRVSPQIVEALVIACTDQIYEDHDQVPHHFFSLKFMVRRRAKLYAKKYVRDGGKTRV